MIFYVVTGSHHYTVKKYFKLYEKDFPVCPEIVFYEQLSVQKEFKPGAYIFADLERLTPEQAEQAARIWQLLNDHGMPVLNHPTHFMRRYQLLRTLYEHGINQHNIYRLTEARIPQHFPVFLRGENEHGGNVSPPLNNVAELNAAIADLEAQGLSLEDKVIVELVNTADETGLIRKYGAMIIGDQILADHMMFSQHWMVKSATSFDPLPQVFADEELDYMRTNPHEAMIREVVNIARVEYGRIDYGMKDGKIQVWEINSNPSLALNLLPELGGYTEAIRLGVEAYNRALNRINDIPLPSHTVVNQHREQWITRVSGKILTTLPRSYVPHIRERWRDYQWHRAYKRTNGKSGK